MFCCTARAIMRKLTIGAMCAALIAILAPSSWVSSVSFASSVAIKRGPFRCWILVADSSPQRSMIRSQPQHFGRVPADKSYGDDDDTKEGSYADEEVGERKPVVKPTGYDGLPPRYISSMQQVDATAKQDEKRYISSMQQVEAAAKQDEKRRSERSSIMQQVEATAQDEKRYISSKQKEAAKQDEKRYISSKQKEAAKDEEGDTDDTTEEETTDETTDEDETTEDEEEEEKSKKGKTDAKKKEKGAKRKTDKKVEEKMSKGNATKPKQSKREEEDETTEDTTDTEETTEDKEEAGKESTAPARDEGTSVGRKSGWQGIASTISEVHPMFRKVFVRDMLKNYPTHSTKVKRTLSELFGFNRFGSSRVALAYMYLPKAERTRLAHAFMYLVNVYQMKQRDGLGRKPIPQVIDIVRNRVHDKKAFMDLLLTIATNADFRAVSQTLQ